MDTNDDTSEEQNSNDTQSEPVQQAAAMNKFLISEYLQQKRPIELLGFKVELSYRWLVIAMEVLVCILLIVWLNRLTTRLNTAESQVCQTAACVSESARMHQLMNASIDPCQDFYEYACQNFQRFSPLGQRAADNIEKALERKNERKIRHLLTKKTWQRNGTAFDKLRVVYQSCMASNDVLDKHVSLERYINSLGGWDLYTTFKQHLFSFKATYMKVSEEKTSSLLMELILEVTDKIVVLNVQRNRLPYRMFQQRSWQNQLFYIYQLANMKKDIIELLAKLQNASTIAGKTESCGQRCSPETIADDIVEMERKLYEIHRDLLFKTKKPMYLSSAKKLCPSFPLQHLLFGKFGGAFAGRYASVETEEEFLTKLEELIQSTNASAMNNYIMWSVTLDLLPAMGVYYKNNMKAMTAHGLRRYKLDTEAMCYGMMNYYLPLAMRSLFFKEHLGVEQLPSVKKFYNVLNETFVKNLDWMDEKERNETLSKISRLKLNYATSSIVESTEEIDEYYKHLTVHENDFFKNLREMSKFRDGEFKNHMVMLVADKLDILELILSDKATVSRLYLDRARGILYIPPGVLQGPYFGSSLPNYMNTAGLGVNVFYRLWHYADTYTRPSRRWSITPRKRGELDSLEDYTTCTYDNLRGHKIEAFGRIPNGEYTTDSDGRKWIDVDPGKGTRHLTYEHLAFQLAEQYMKQEARVNTMKTLPGSMRMSPTRIFYTLYAQSLCEAVSPRHVYVRYKMRRNFPRSVMINNFVYNSPDFRKAFQCQSVPQAHSRETCSLYVNQK